MLLTWSDVTALTVNYNEFFRLATANANSRLLRDAEKLPGCRGADHLAVGGARDFGPRAGQVRGTLQATDVGRPEEPDLGWTIAEDGEQAGRGQRGK